MYQEAKTSISANSEWLHHFVEYDVCIGRDPDLEPGLDPKCVYDNETNTIVALFSWLDSKEYIEQYLTHRFTVSRYGEVTKLPTGVEVVPYTAGWHLDQHHDSVYPDNPYDDDNIGDYDMLAVRLRNRDSRRRPNERRVLDDGQFSQGSYFD